MKPVPTPAAKGTDFPSQVRPPSASEWSYGVITRLGLPEFQARLRVWSFRVSNQPFWMLSFPLWRIVERFRDAGLRSHRRLVNIQHVTCSVVEVVHPHAEEEVQ